MGIARARGFKGKCDKLTTEILKLRFNCCERCGSRDWLQTSHIISRRYSATRCMQDNVQLLCAKCHRRLTDFPREFSQWITESIGSAKYEKLRRLAEENTSKMDWEALFYELKQDKKDLETQIDELGGLDIA